jgi:hypothetical protein
VIERHAPRILAGHDAADAQRNAGGIEYGRDTFGESGEPAVFFTARLAFGKDDRIVLIEREQAFAASA